MTGPLHELLGNDNAALYQALQQRMRPGGDLSPTSPYQTMAQHYRNGTWNPDRLAHHRRILNQMRDANAHKPRGGRAVLLTAGPPGAGKTSTLQLLADPTAAPENQLPELPLALDDYVTIDADQFKHALLTHPDTRPHLPDHALHHPDGRQLAPAEMASVVHAESAHLANQFALWAREHGHNLLYDTTLRTPDRNTQLLHTLRDHGYHQRLIISIDAPMDAALAGNAARWHHGRRAFDTGADPYGGRLAPEHHIRDLYQGHPADYSASRLNARQLAATGASTTLIEVDRQHDQVRDAVAPREVASTHRLSDVTVYLEPTIAIDSDGGSELLRAARHHAAGGALQAHGPTGQLDLEAATPLQMAAEIQHLEEAGDPARYAERDPDTGAGID